MAGTRLGTAYVDVQPSWAKFDREITRKFATMGKGVDLDPRTIKGYDRLGKSMAGARKEANGLAASTRQINVDRSAARNVNNLGSSLVRTRRSSEGLHGSLLRAKLVLGTLAVPPIAQGLSAGTAGAVALTSALGPLAGSLAALPALASAAGQAIATIGLAGMGIGDTVKAAFDAQSSAAKDAGKSLEDTRAKADALHGAERGLADAQRQARYAQEEVNAARKQAARDLIDLKNAADDAQLSERGAEIGVRRAQEELRRAMREGSATELDEAILGVDQAREALDQARTGRSRAVRDWQTAEAQGIRQAPQVVQAERAKADANRQVADAQRQVASAQRQMATTAAAGSSAQDKLAEEMAKLPPEAQAFARQVIALKPQFDDLRRSAGRDLFPGLSVGVTRAQRNLPVFNSVLRQTGGALGRVAADAGDLIGSKAFGRDLETIGSRNARWTEQLGKGLTDVFSGFRHLIVAAGPFTQWLVDVASGWAKNFEATQKLNRETGVTARYLERTRAVMTRLWSIGSNLAGAFAAIGRAARPLGDDMWRAIDRGTARFEQWAKSARGQNSLRQWFANARDTGNAVLGVLREAQTEFARLRGEGKSFTDAFIIAGSDVFAKFLSHAAAQVGKHIPTIVRAFISGFVNSDLWGKLLIGGWLITKFKAWPALFRKMGAANGAAWSSGFAGAATAGAPAAAAGGAAAGGAAAAGAGGARGRENVSRGGVILPPGAAVPGAKDAPKAAGKLRGFFTALGPVARTGGWLALGYSAIRGMDAAFSDKARQLTTGGKIQQFLSGASFGLVPAATTAATKARNALMTGSGNWRGAVLKALMSGDVSAEQRQQLQKLATFRGQVERMFGKGVRIQPTYQPGDFTRIRNEFGRLRNGAVISAADIRKTVGDNFTRIARSMGTHTAAGRRAVQQNFSAGLSAIRRSMSDGSVSVREGMGLMRNLMSKQSGLGKAAIGKNYNAIEAQIKRTMSRGGRLTAEGMAFMRETMVNEMKDLGLSKNDIRMSLNKKASAKKGFTQPGQRGGTADMIAQGTQGWRRGGPINIGKQTGDSVPAVLERGEYVMNRKAVKAVGVDRLNAVNFAQAPRFQKGGQVGMQRGGLRQALGPYTIPPIQYDANHAGGNSHLHINMNSRGATVAIGKKLQKMGWMVGEHPDFGGVQGRHSATGGHYNATAIDANTSADETRAQVAAVAKLLKTGKFSAAADGGGGGGQFKKLARVLVNGPDSAMKSVVQGRLDQFRGAANRRGQQLADKYGATSMEGAETVPLGAGPAGKKIFDYFRKQGFTRNQAAAWVGNFMQESGLRPGAVQPGGPGRGLAQWGDSRFTALQAFARSRGTGWANMQTQLDFVMHELRGPESAAYAAIKGARSLEAAVDAIGSKYERYGIKGDRYGPARKALAAYGQAGGLVQMLQAGGATIAAAKGKAKPKGKEPKGKSKLGAVFKEVATRQKRSKKTFGKLENPPPGFFLSDNIKRFDQLERWITDQESLFSSEQQWFNLDEVLSQDELNQLANRQGGIIGAYATQFNLVKDAILPDTKQKVAAFEKTVERRKKRATKLVADIKKAQEKYAKLGKQEAAEQKAFNRLKKPTAAQKKARARSKAAIAKKRAGLVTDNRERRRELQALTGNEGIPDVTKLESEATEDSLIGKARVARDGYRDSLTTDPGWENLLRPSELPSKLNTARFALAELLKAGATKPDNTEGDAAQRERADLLQQLLNESNLRTAVSERQFDVFKNAPRFHTGGVVPGPASQERMAVLKGQETVRTVEQERALSQPVQVQVIVRDGAVDPSKIEVIATKAVRDENRRSGVSLSRTLGI